MEPTGIILQTFYRTKRYIPRRLQIVMRRIRAHVKLRKHGSIWPIDEKAARPPKEWKGWPDGKRFAFVLTHDVETETGRDRCRELMKIDQEFGFVSSFNFVPERYDMPEGLRDELASLGFEVGVHDLRHDGKLFCSRSKFLENAKSINRYLHEWKAAGFRAGSMHRNLDWLHSLDIEYDASTFDTDPFEPQPKGYERIFPTWIDSSNGARRGYVEMPYTMPQDFTLFVILKEKSIDIWKRKLDWVAAHGGMVLMITHPDYMALNGRPRMFDEYPAEFYRELLQYVKDRYAGQYWNTTPREVSRHYRKNCVPSVNESRYDEPLPIKACMVAYTIYERDNRVRRYAEALVKQGSEVDVFSLRQPGQPDWGELNGVTIHRIQKRVHNEKSRVTYLAKLLLFLLHSSVVLTKHSLREKYDVIHVHTVPDFEVFAAFIPKLLGSKIILDIHDPANCLYAKDVISFAREKGWFSGKDSDFSFADTYAPLDFGALRACDARVWSVFRRAAPSLDLSADVALRLDTPVGSFNLSLGYALDLFQ